MSSNKKMNWLREAWAALPSRLTMLEPLPLSADDWSLLERLHTSFNDRAAHARLPLVRARFRDEAVRAIHAAARELDHVETVAVDDAWQREQFAAGAAAVLAGHMRRYNDDVDAMMGLLVPRARYRKGHYAYGRFTAPQPHGLHTDHSAEDPRAAGEPICIARIETLGTHYVAGDYGQYDRETRSMLQALRYWIAVPEGEPETILGELLRRGTLRTIPVNSLVLMVAGNASADTQVTQHIAARPPAGGLHSAFFQRQYRLAPYDTAPVP